jgi:dihydrofolate reductase
MKLTTITHVSVDGVMQGLGGADEDRRGGFERGGWALPLFSDEGVTFVNQVFQRADAFLFGRRTYEIFAPYWGAMDPGSGPIADALNTMPKYVASTTLRPAMGGHDRPLRRRRGGHRRAESQAGG